MLTSEVKEAQMQKKKKQFTTITTASAVLLFFLRLKMKAKKMVLNLFA